MEHNLELGETIKLTYGKWIAYDDGRKYLYFALNDAVINGKEYNVTDVFLYQPNRDKDGSSIAPYVENFYSDLTDAAKRVIRDYLLANGPSVQERVLTEKEIARRVQLRKKFLEEKLKHELIKYEAELRGGAKAEVYYG